MQKFTQSTFILIIAVLLFSLKGFSQGATCSNAQPFCSDITDGITFPNTSNASSAEQGPDYGCLADQPNPAWYYLQIKDSGDLNLRITQNTNQDGTGTGLDVDYIVWGPFNDVNVCSPSDLSNANIIDCSFLPDPVEFVSIRNAVEDEIYLMLITNFDGSPGFISLEQTGGNGSTDCSIVAGNLGLDQFPCQGDVVTLDGTSNNAVGYRWFFNGTEIIGETSALLEVSDSGTYTVEVSDSEGNSDTDEIEITFVPQPVPGTVTDIETCADTTGQAFDLAATIPAILNGQNPMDFIITFHQSQSDAELENNPLPNTYTTTAENTPIFIRMANILNEACATTNTSFNLITNINPTITPINNLELCDDDTDGDVTNRLLQNIDLNVMQGEILNERTGLTITYYQTATDAENSTNQIIASAYNNTQANEEIYYRIQDNVTSCFAVGSFELIVEAGVALQNSTLEQCDGIDGSIDGLSVYNLNEANASFLISGDVNDHIFSFYLNQTDAETGQSPVEPLGFSSTIPNQILYVRVQRQNSNCFYYTQLELGTTTTAIPNAILEGCSDSGFFEFDLNQANAQILDATIPLGATIVYYPTFNDAQLETNALSSLFTNTQINSQTIFSRVEEDNACFGIGEVSLVINQIPTLILPQRVPLCMQQDLSTPVIVVNLDTQLDPLDHRFEWYLNNELLNETTSQLSVSMAGTYSVIVEEISTGCTTNASVEVFASSRPYNLEVDYTSEPFSNITSFTIVFDGIGIYEYQPENAPKQLEPEFELGIGEYEITVCDTNGCGCDSVVASVLDYPRFFTPNGDDSNETWNIPASREILNPNISIFDRYGKLLRQIVPGGEGWDGTFNGRPLPSSDYWFLLTFEAENDGLSKQIKGHFSLKR